MPFHSNRVLWQYYELWIAEQSAFYKHKWYNWMIGVCFAHRLLLNIFDSIGLACAAEVSFYKCALDRSTDWVIAYTANRVTSHIAYCFGFHTKQTRQLIPVSKVLFNFLLWSFNRTETGFRYIHLRLAEYIFGELETSNGSCSKLQTKIQFYGISTVWPVSTLFNKSFN